MSPTANRSISIGVLGAVLATCLAVVTPSLAGILQHGSVAAPSPRWLWQSHIYGGSTPRHTAPSHAKASRPAHAHHARAARPAVAATPATHPVRARRRRRQRHAPPPLRGIHKIRHVIFVIQENRSFDSYFGTFPGADGLPMQNGQPAVCVPDPNAGDCVRPFHDTHNMNFGGPHNAASAVTDINGGAMDGFVGQAEQGRLGCLGAGKINDPQCTFHPGQPDVMGYHTAAEIPNYWAYARRYVLMDHLFETNLGWSEPAHLFRRSCDGRAAVRLSVRSIRRVRRCGGIGVGRGCRSWLR